MKRISFPKAVAVVFSLCLLAGVASYVVVAANAEYEINPTAIRMKSYSSIDELRDDSARVVVATVVSARGYDGQGIPSTEYELRPISSREPLSVLQDGTPDRISPEGDAFLKVGSTYLLFLLEANAPQTLHAPYYITGVVRHLPLGW